MHFDSIVAPWTRFEGESAYLVGFMPEESRLTIGNWGWLDNDPVSDIGRLQLKDLIEDDLRGAKLVRVETGFYGRDNQFTPNTMLAKTVLLRRRAGWLCQPYEARSTDEVLPGPLLTNTANRASARPISTRFRSRKPSRPSRRFLPTCPPGCSRTGAPSAPSGHP